MNRSAELRALYRRIPQIDCKRLCQEACGPIGCSREERRIIVKASGRAPKPDGALTCSLLVNGLCSVYAVRPTVCRLWGTVPSMACPHGCVPERWLSEQEARQILADSLRIGGEDKHQMRDLANALKRYQEVQS